MLRKNDVITMIAIMTIVAINIVYFAGEGKSIDFNCSTETICHKNNFVSYYTAQNLLKMDLRRTSRSTYIFRDNWKHISYY